MSGETTCPLITLIEEARTGALNLRMEPEEFARLDRECTEFETVIRQTMTDVSNINTWGFGDNSESGLTSARVMAHRFRGASDRLRIEQGNSQSLATEMTRWIDI